jgi:hypothetical protein
VLQHWLTRLPPIFVAILLQAVALLGVSLAVHLGSILIPKLSFALSCGLMAALMSYFVGMAKWWLPIQLLFVPTLVVMLSLNLPPMYSLVAFSILLLVYWSTFRTQVPLYLSSRKVWQELETLLPDHGQFNFIDIGSGLGGVLVHLAGTHPEGRYEGVESAPLPFLASRLRIFLGGIKNCRVHWGSFWAIDLGDYDVVFAYLSPVPMPDLWQKVHREMHPGSLFVSNTFEVPGQMPERVITVEDMHRSTLYIWRI